MVPEPIACGGIVVATLSPGPYDPKLVNSGIGGGATTAGGRPVVELRFGRAGTVVSALVVLAFAAMVGGLVASTSRVESLSFPESSLTLVAGRTMDLRVVTDRQPRWERYLTQFLMDDPARELAQLVDWYEELVARSSDAGVDLQLAILEGEAGRRLRLREKLDGWDVRPDPYPAMAAAIRGAYLGDGDAADDAVDHLPSDGHPWFGEQLALRLAQRRGDQGEVQQIVDERSTRTQSLTSRLRVLVGLELAVLLAGVLSAVMLVRDRGGLRLAGAPLPPPWSGQLGAVVLIRGAAIQVALIGLFYVVAQLVASDVLSALLWPWTNLMFLPMLLLARRHLVEPAGLRMRDALGLSLDPGTRNRVVCVVLMLIALGLAGDWLASEVAARAGRSAHWTEWFDEDVVWGAGGDAALAIMSAVLAAPFFEEIVFRGLLFATFRRRFGVVAAALGSSLIFAVAHGYGWAGLFSVLWSGALWAWSYERTRSLVPGMLAHAAVNLLASLGLLLLLR
jgi:membrane protease YdiL (CAAX protease family)